MYFLKRYVRQEARIIQITKKSPEGMGLEDGVVGAVNVDKDEHGVVQTLTSYKLYEFMYYLKSFIT